MYDSTFFKTKYCIPRANPSTVSRKRLQEKLDRAPERTLTLVVAPMGYGKTTAVYKWAEQSGLPTAWLSLDTGDNDTIVFWKYFFAAAEQILPGIADKAAYTFSSRQLLEANVHINMLVDELARHGGKATLVIDDLHTVTNGQILKGLSHLLRYLPVSVHMIVISRTEPAIELEKLELQSQVLRITAQDLRFRQDEIADFYLKRDCAFGTEMIEKIGGYTEGWVAAMVAVAVSSQNDCVSHDLPDGVTVTDPAIYQYLMNEVFESYPPEKQAFLLKISILELLREDICRAVTGEDNAARFFEDMRKRNEFLTVLGDESGAYRLHPILKDFLLRKLKQDFDMFAGLHRKAAMWYRDKDLLPPAVSHYLSGMWYGEALELIEMQLGGFASKNEYETACSWLEQLPEQYKNKSAKIAVFYSMYHAQNRDFDAALRWVGYAKELVKEDQTGEIGIRDRILVAISPINLLFREGNAEELCKLIQNNEIHKSMTVKAIEYVDLNGTDIYVYRSPVHIMIKMFEISSEAVGKLRESYNLLCAKNPGFIPLAVGECYYERNRPEDALPPLLDAMESAKLLSYPGVMVPAMANLSRIKRCKGDMAGALLVLEECENRLKAIQKPHWNDMVTALKIRWYLETGDTDRALEWLGINKLQIFSEINRVREFELLVLARVLWADKNTDDAEILLMRLLRFTEAQGRLHSRVEVLNLLAMIASHKGNVRAAVSYMEKSLLIGLSEGYVRSYIDEQTPILTVLRQTASAFKKTQTGSTELRSFTDSLIASIQGENNVPSGGSAANCLKYKSLLTKKEYEVLQLLCDACSNEEIGKKLFICQRTVKAHTGSIYGKLGVKTRAQCVKLVRGEDFPQYK